MNITHQMLEAFGIFYYYYYYFHINNLYVKNHYEEMLHPSSICLKGKHIKMF